ncbi:hypothetical protein EV213_13219 [Aureibacillus halotolerans]|uniref:YoqO-like protein n=1 Tax=Aureibacillus halotolerans TaxID=1508390 RepID=A0A4R6TPZ9_9BACI|nr:hypothetical protein EV213_13219 [Aureibacillus halotolerans]
MNKKAFHILNIVTLLILLTLNLLLIIAAGMSEGEQILPYLISVALSFVIWGTFYRIQFTKANTTWKVVWFCLMIVILYFWQTGLGMFISNAIFRLFE